MILGDIFSYWDTLYQVIILCVVMGMASVGVAVKVGLSVFDEVISIKQRQFLKWVYSGSDEKSESSVRSLSH